MSESKTIRVHQYAECSAEEADEHPRGSDLMCRYDSGAIVYTDRPHPTQAVRYLGCVEMPAPKKPKVRVVYRFEEVAEPCASEDGRWWYDTDSGPEYRWGATHPLRRTVERIPVEPERWEGRVKTIMLQPDGWAAVTTISRVGSSRPRIELGCSAFPTPAEAEADLPILRDLAEQYAAHYGATIEWKEAGA